MQPQLGQLDEAGLSRDETQLFLIKGFLEFSGKKQEKTSETVVFRMRAVPICNLEFLHRHLRWS